MSPQRPVPFALSHLVVVRDEPPGQFTAEAVGLPEIRATCANRDEAIERVRLVLREWALSGRLVEVVTTANPPPKENWHTDPNDPSEKAYLEELERFRREDLERTLREYEQEDQACSNSSSTPTT